MKTALIVLCALAAVAVASPNVTCINCMDAMAMPKCPYPQRCGYKPVDGCVDCMDGMAMPDCPYPGKCGYNPTSDCADCMDGMPMPNCPDPSKCGFQPSCTDCMAGMAMPDCPNPDACGVTASTACVMRSTFVAETNVCLWSENLHATKSGQYALLALLIIALSAVREGLSIYRQHRHFTRSRAVSKLLASGATQSLMGQSVDSSSAAYASLATARTGSFRSTKELCADTFVDSLLYLASLVLAYLLMLAVMTYNVGMFLIVCLACFAFHWLFAFLVGHFLAVDGDHCCDP